MTTEVKVPPGEALIPTSAPAAMQLALELGATTDSISLVITDPDLPFENWENIGRCIGFAGNAWQWWAGDWINTGEALYGEESAQGVDDPTTRYDALRRVTGQAQQTLLNVSSVCRKVSRERRRGELTFTHHAAVASLEPDEQTRWLQAAIDNNWSVSELKQAIKDEKHPDDGGGEPQVLPGLDGPSVSERIEEAARQVYRAASIASHGEYVVPAEPMHQLAAALGEEA